MAWASSRPPFLGRAFVFCIYAVLVTFAIVFLFFFTTWFTPRPRSLPPFRILKTLSANLSPDLPTGRRYTSHSSSIFDYASLPLYFSSEGSIFSVIFLSLVILLQFFFLVKVAGDHFSPVVSQLARHLKLSPSMGAVTLLALGNGAPDVFSSVAAVRGGQARTAIGAILSAGAFVSALVVGFVAIYAAPFSVDPAPFIRDVFFYLVAASALFYVYLSAEIYLWQALGFVLFYAVFVLFVFRMDSGAEEGKSMERYAGDPEIEMNFRVDDLKQPPSSSSSSLNTTESGAVFGFLGKIAGAWEIPVSAPLKLTIPSTCPSEWSRFYSSANIAFCPPAILFLGFRSIVPLNHRPVVFLLALTITLPFSIVHYLRRTEPPSEERLPPILLAFCMSVLWISTTAGELLSCLAELGVEMGLSPAVLGLTVLAWGNSVGDLVADIAVARAGRPAMAMAGCFAGPMFNMLVGLGTGLAFSAADVHPRPYELHFHASIVVAFIFLLLSLMGSLLVVTWCRFHVPRFWGFFLVSLYALFTIISLAVSALAS